MVLSGLIAVGLSSPPAHAAPPITPNPTTPMVGESFTVTGKLSTKVVRPVELQVKVGKKWKRLSTGKTDKTGRYSLTASTTKSSITVRVVAKRVRIKGHTYKAVTTKSRVMKTIGSQTATLSMPPVAEVNGQVNAQLAFTPARNGRPVQVEQLISGSWTKLADGVEAADGTTTIQLTATVAGSYSYRAYAPAWHGAPAVGSNVVVVNVTPSKVVTKDVQPITSTELAALTSYDAASGTLTFNGGSASLGEVKAGTVVTLPPRDGAPSGVLRKVTKVSVNGATTTFETEQAALTDAFARIPESSSQIGLSLIQSTFIPNDGVTVKSVPVVGKRVKGAGMRATALDALRLGIDFDLAGGIVRWAVKGEAAISVVQDFNVNLDMDGLHSYRIGSGVVNSTQFTSKLGFKTSGTKSLDLGRWVQVVGGTIGPVPVWLEEDTRVILEIGADGEIGIVTETSLSGVTKSGIENTSASDLTPKPYTSAGTVTTNLSQIAFTGKVTGFMGAEADLSIYSVIGPFARLGAQAQFDVSIPFGSPQPPMKCSVTFGPHAEVGFKTNEDFNKLFGMQFKTAAAADFFSVTQEICPQPTAAETLAVSTSTPSAAEVGHSYRALLSASGGAGGYTWAASGLPSWLTLDSETGVLTGDGPADPGSHPIHVTVTDAIGATASADITVQVVAHKAAAAITARCLIAGDKTVWCWGANQEGELGSASDLASSRLPVQVSGISDAVAIASGTGHNCAVLGSGEVWCWGQNDYGQVGDGTDINRFAPVKVPGISTAVSVAAGATHTCAVLHSGTVTCWGSNSSGELGDGTQFDDGGGGGFGVESAGQVVKPASGPSDGPVMVTGITDAVEVALGANFSCALRAAGTVKCWGDNSHGKLGDGTIESSPLPVAVVGLGGEVVDLSAGWYHACVVLADHTVKCWGPDQMMEPTGATSVTGLSNVRSVAVGFGGRSYCAALNSGGVECWGTNEWGQLGRVQDYNTFHDPAPVAGISDAKAVASSGSVSCALSDDSSVHCWGWGDQLGDDAPSHGYTAPINSIDYSPAPVGVHGFS